MPICNLKHYWVGTIAERCSVMQVKEVESVIPDLVLDFQRFFLLDMTDKKWQEHLQVNS